MKAPKLTFNEWQERSTAIRKRAERLQKSMHERGWRLAAAVDIPRDMCCLHNASIDTELRGWCKGNPERLKVAKAARHILDDWTPTRLAESITRRMFERTR